MHFKDKSAVSYHYSFGLVDSFKLISVIIQNAKDDDFVMFYCD